MVTLTVYRGGDQPVQELDLEGPEIRIGRSVDNQVVLPDDGKVVSRVHAVLRVEGDTYVLLDNNSKIGTTVDGKKIKRAVLQPGQEFVIGPFRLVFNLAGAAVEDPDLKDTIAAALPAELAPEIVDGTAPPPAPAQTHNTQGHGSGTVGVKPKPDRVGSWVANQPWSLVYGVGAGALVLLGGILIWMALPSYRDDPPIANNAATTTTIATTAPTTVPVPPVSPEEISAVRTALETVDGTLVPSRPGQRIRVSQYTAAAQEYDRINAELIQPLVAKDPANPDILALQQQAQEGATKARAAIEAGTTVTTTPTTIAPTITDTQGLQRQAGESDSDFVSRIERATREHDRGRALLMKREFLEAYKVLSALRDKEPTLNGINASVSSATTQLEQAREEALSVGVKRNEDGNAALKRGNYAAAVPALTEAWKALARAVELDAPNAETYAQNNLKQRQFAAGEILANANNYTLNPKFSDEAKKFFQWVIDLLPDGDATKIQAQSALRKLGS